MIYIGTSGYFYHEWIRNFYTYKNKPERWIYVYARHFNSIELAETAEQKLTKDFLYKFAEESESQLKINIKLPKEITLRNINNPNISANLMDAQKTAKLWENLYYERWIGQVIFEFPFSFRFTLENFKKLKSIISFFMEYKKTIEFQHNSWINKEIIDYMSQNKISFCLRDVPEFENQVNLSNYLLTSDLAYIKLYGKNSQNWWNPAVPEDKTDYDYSTREINVFANTFKKNLLNHTKDVYIIFANIKNALAVKNGTELCKKLKVSSAIKSDQLELPLFY